MSTIFENSVGQISSIEEVKIKNAYNIMHRIIDKHKEKVFVKLDSEGAEFEILPLLSKKGLLGKVDVLIIEYHKKDFKILLDILQANNFFYFLEKSNATGIIKAIKIK